MDIRTALRAATCFVACQDFFLGGIGLLSISVTWSSSGTVLPIFQGKFSATPNEWSRELPFLDDINRYQYLILGLVLTVGFMFLFAIILGIGAYKKNLLTLEIWSLLNIITLILLGIGLVFLALTEYAVPFAILGGIPLGFRSTEVCLVFAFKQNLSMNLKRDKKEKNKKVRFELPRPDPEKTAKLSKKKPKLDCKKMKPRQPLVVLTSEVFKPQVHYISQKQLCKV